MRAAYEWFAQVSVWWWPRFADHLWQTTLFVLVILAVVFVLRRSPARIRQFFYILAGAKFIIPATLFVFLAYQAGIDSLTLFHDHQQTQQNALLLYGISQPVATLAASYEVTVVATEAVEHKEVYVAISAIWLTGSLALLVVWTIRRRKFLRSLQLGHTVRDGREWRALQRGRETLDLKVKIDLLISPLKTEPAVWRVWRPVIVLPESIASHLNDEELEAIILHELVHIQRRDNLIGNLQLALCALLWFHPLVWFIARKLFDEREQACDEKVMEVFQSPEAYASSILKVVRFCFGWRVAGVIGAGSGSNLRRRIENIMSTENTKRGAGAASRLLAGTLLGVALLILAGAGIYSRPRAISAAAKETELRTSSVIDAAAPEALAAVDRKLSKKTKHPPSPPSPPAAPTIATPPSPPVPQSSASAPSTPSTPTQPTPPAEPAQPTTPAAPQEKNKDKDSKEKSKDKLFGKLIEAPQPVYPEEAKKQKIEGTVVVAIVIGDDGNVISAKAKSGPEPLYGAAETAASKARFKPSTVNGKRAKVVGAMTYNFVLDK
jgi:TonB family protein